MNQGMLYRARQGIFKRGKYMCITGWQEKPGGVPKLRELETVGKCAD